MHHQNNPPTPAENAQPSPSASPAEMKETPHAHEAGPTDIDSVDGGVSAGQSPVSPNLPPVRATWSGGNDRPENPRQHPDFTKGNTVAVKHGGESIRLAMPAAVELLEEMAPALPDYLREPRYRPALVAYCNCLVRIARVQDWLERTAPEGAPPETDREGNVRQAANLLVRLEREADRHRQSLGLTPLAAARLGKDVATSQSIADLLDERRREREAGGLDG